MKNTVKHAFLAVAAYAAAGSVFAEIAIRSDYPGGNVKIDKIDEAAGVVALRPDLRDTQGNWFHWDFTLSGAAGRRIHFRFPKGYDYLSSLGPAISRDRGKTWRWLNNDGRRHEPNNAFDYTFAPDERETRFAVSIPYSQKDWDAASARWRGKPGVEFGVLCKSQSGRRDTEVLRVPCRRKGAAKWLYVFTARHHACETTASYVMEGVIDELLSGSPDAEWMRDNADCVFVPFMDKDGVEEGDQGKNRRPHDHNRDYIQGIYTSVRAVKNLIVGESNGRQIAFFDLHSPHVRSYKSCPEQDCAFTFDCHSAEKNKRIMEFRRNWAEAQKGGLLTYDGACDIVKGAAKNKEKYDADLAKGLSTSRNWVDDLPNCFVSICCEFGYSLCGGVFTREGGRGLGHSLLKAASRTARNPVAHAAPPPPVPSKADLARPLRVAVYCGDGAFGGGAMRWIQMPLFMDGAEPLFVDGASIRAGALDGADVLVMPGGAAHLQAQELGPAGRKKIEAFIRGGGGYIGTCAGCYLCIHPHNKYPYMAIAPYRNAAKGDTGEMRSRRIEFVKRAKELCGIEPGARGVYYHGGPVMEAVKKIVPDDVRFEPIAFYGLNAKSGAGKDGTARDAGKIAVAVGSAGKGRVFACAVHPESVFNPATHIVKGAFKYVTGRDVEIRPPDVFAPGLPKALFVAYDGYGVDVARTILELARHKEFSVVPVAVSKLGSTSFDGYSAIVLPDGIGSEKCIGEAIGFLGKNAAKLKAFHARGGRILAWGRGAGHLEKQSIPFVRAKDGEEAVALLSGWLAKPLDAAARMSKTKALAKLLKPLRTWALPYAAGVPVEAFVSRHEPPRAGPSREPQPWTAMDADDFFPFIDKYGQFIHKDWPDKIHSDADFAARREKEEKDLAAHPGPEGWDKWGGWAAGPQLEKRGGFYTAKWNGKWWIVDPDGHLWWSHGPVRVLPSSAMTPLAVPGKDRSGWFAELPARDDPVFGAFYKTRDELLWPYYGKRGIDKVYDFSAANIRRKYGENWFDTWADLAHRRLRSWGCNTIANSSDRRICMMDRTPYTERFEIHARPIAGHKGGWWEFCDPFDPSFRAEARRMTEVYRAEIDDPWCVGFFVDNEHQWGKRHTFALSTLKSPADQPCKIAFRDRLKKKYGTVGKLNEAWKTSYSGWDAFLACVKEPESLAGAMPDLEAFSSEIADAYFRIIREELKRANPGKLYLGCRWAQKAPDFVVRAAAKYCDVVSYNIYAKDLRSFRLPDGVDMPVLIGEFHFGALDRGPFCPGLILLKDQQERAGTYKDYVRSALEHPQFVGVHWHQFSDQATSGRFDGENMQVGWTDVCDTPYWETVAAVRETGAEMYAVRAGTVASNDYSWVRGTHYRINGDAEKTARELGYGKRIGLNAVRFWTSMGEWRKNRAAAVEKYRTFVRQARECGYRSMPILFNGNGLDPSMLEGGRWAECEAYAKDVVGALKGEPGLLMWDVMNEPTYNGWVGDAPDAAEKSRRRGMTHGFVRRACALVKSLDPGTPVTLGCANCGEAAETADCVDVLSFHDYSSTRGDIENAYAQMEALGKRTGKPVLQSETGCTGCGNTYEMALEACERHKFGWFFFNLVVSGYTETFHGVFYEDGTVRHPDAIAAMAGCHRCRDMERIVPAQPFKPGKEARLAAVVENLRAAMGGGDATRLFEEMERAANYLESCELVPMSVPPTARIGAWRRMKNPPADEVKAFAAALARKLEECIEPRKGRKS